MENTITSTTFEPNDSFTIDQNWQNLKAFQAQFHTIEHMTKPYLGKNPTADKAREYAELLEAYEQNRIAIRKQQEDNASIIQAAFNVFEDYVKDKAGLNDIPEQYRAKVWSYAYERGHSSGYSEVFNCLLNVLAIFS